MADELQDGKKSPIHTFGQGESGQVSDNILSRTSSKKNVSPSRLSEVQRSEAMQTTARSASRTTSSTSNSPSVSAVASVASGNGRYSSIDPTQLDQRTVKKVNLSPDGLPASSRSSASSPDERDLSPRSESELEKSIFASNNPLFPEPATISRKRKRSDQEDTSLKHIQYGSTDNPTVRSEFTSAEAPAISRQGGLTPIEEHGSNQGLGVAQPLADSFGGTPVVTTPCTEVDNIFDENGTASSSQLAKKAVKPERRLPGRKRQPNPDINIEADLRRQLQLKTNYRTVAKALKPILAELAKRTIEEIREDDEAYRRHKQYEVVLKQLNTRLQERLAYLNKSYRLKKKYVEDALQADRNATRDESIRVVQNLQDDHLLKCKCHLLSAERNPASDSDMTDDEDGPVQPLEGVGYPYKFKGALGCKYDSRSRYFMEVGRLWQEKDVRHRVKINYSQQVASEDEEINDGSVTRMAGNHIQGFATFDVTRYEHATATFNVLILADAAQEVQKRRAVDQVEPKSAKSTINSLEILASASEVAAAAETSSKGSTKKRKHLLEKADTAKKQSKTKNKKPEPQEDTQVSTKMVKQSAHVAGEELEPGHKDADMAETPDHSGRDLVNSPKRVKSPVVSRMEVDRRITNQEKLEMRKPQPSKINDLLNSDIPGDVAISKRTPIRSAGVERRTRISDWPWSETSTSKEEKLYIEADKPRYEPQEPRTENRRKSPAIEDSQTRRNSFWSTVRRPSQTESSTYTTWPYEGHARKASYSSTYKSDEGRYGFHRTPQTIVQQGSAYPTPSLQQNYIPIQKPGHSEPTPQEVRYQRSEAYPHSTTYSQQNDIHEQSLRDSWEEGRRRSRELTRYEPAYRPIAAPHYRSSSSTYPTEDPHTYESVRRDGPNYDTRLDARDSRTAPQYRPSQAYSHHGPYDYEGRHQSYRAPHHRSSSYSQDAPSFYGSGHSQSQYHDGANHRSQSSRPYYNSAASSPSYSTYSNYSQPYHHPHSEYQLSYQHYPYPPQSTTEPSPTQILPPPQPQPQSQPKGYQGSQYGGQAILPANSESHQGYYSGPSSYATPQHSPAFSQLHAINSTNSYSRTSEQPYRIGSGNPPYSAAAPVSASAPTTAAVTGLEPKRRSRGRGSLPNPEFRRYFGPKRR